MNPLPRLPLKQLIGWALGLGLLAWLMAQLPLTSLPQALARIGWDTWLLACGALLLSYGLRAARMQVVLARHAGLWWPRREAWRLMLLSNGAVVLLPLRSGELVFPWLAARELGVTTAVAVAAWVWMRVQDLAVLTLLAVLAWPGFGAPWRAALVAGWLLGVALLQPLARALLARLPAFTALPAEDAAPVAGWRRKLVGALGKLRLALQDRAHHHPLAWLYTAANWGVKMAGGSALLAAAAGIGWAPAWAGMVGAEVVSILPVHGPAGFGTFEAGVHAGVAWLGGLGAATPPTVVLAALVWHLTLLAGAVAGAALCGWRGLPPPATDAAQSPTQPPPR